jgi:hypothetical protein
MLSLLLHSLPGVRAVCTHCKDTITPGHLDAACPLVVGIAANAQMFANKALGGSPTLTYSLTHEMAAHFTRPVVDAIMGIACAPCQGAQVDLKSAAYAQHHAVVKAAVYGHASFAEASAELAERMDAATTDIEVNKIRGALDSLKLGVDSAIHTSSGVLAFCWAKISNVLFKPNGNGDDKSKRPCADFNAGRPCKQLKPDGSCVFAHACNQFVSDKGPNGYCFGDHVRPDCKYVDAKKLKAPAK